MAPPEPLRERARRAYERGRMWHALTMAWPSILIVVGSWPFATLGAWHAAAGAALIVASFWLAGRGGPAGMAVSPALTAGVLPLLLPLLTFRAMCASPSCDITCLAACLAGGAVAGAWFGLRAAHAGGRVEFVASGALIAGLTGSLGCMLVGVAGVAGMVAAFATVAAPLALTRPARA